MTEEVEADPIVIAERFENCGKRREPCGHQEAYGEAILRTE